MSEPKPTYHITRPRIVIPEGGFIFANDAMDMPRIPLMTLEDVERLDKEIKKARALFDLERAQKL